jgi:hypothetical protein
VWALYLSVAANDFSRYIRECLHARAFSRCGGEKDDMPIRFFSTHKDTIAGLSFGAGLIGLSFTIYQIGKTNSTLQATNGYTIQKDAREMIATLREEPAFNDYVLRFDPNKQYSSDVINEANRSIALLINFYLSVFRQYKAGGIITNPIDQNPWAHWRSPMDMMRQG